MASEDNFQGVDLIVAVAFRRAGRLNYYLRGDLALQAGDLVVAETVRGLELGKVIKPPFPIDSGLEIGDLSKIVRKATKEDLHTDYLNKLRAANAFKIALAKIKAHGLPMKLLEVEYTLDGGRIVFYFYSEGRVDFRALVRDLAAHFRRRIELYQVGARDRAKLTGGLGPCGRQCCCASWLRTFTSVSIKMTKAQGLALNPGKISGSCGRLMCCIRYEYETYLDLIAKLPAVGTELEQPEGKVTVLKLNPLKQNITVKNEEGKIYDIPWLRPDSFEDNERKGCRGCSGGGCGLSLSVTE